MTLALMFALSAIGVAYAEPVATALPTGGQVVSGNAAIASTGATLNVNQNSQRAIVNWDSFQVGKDATVNFNQPNSGASTLNKIGGNSPSQVFGKINAPGEVILQNTAGVYFSPSAKVDVGALTATTHTISNDDYNNGNYHFDRNGSTGAVVNEGSIAAGLKGYVALLAPEVRNGGVIVAQMGSVVMASGERVTLNFDTSSHLASITTTAATINTLIENKSAVTVNGGQIILSAKALNALVAGVIKQSGTLDASNVATKFTSVGGRIMIDGDNVTLSSGSQTLAKGSAAGGSVTITASKTLTTEATSVVNVSSVDAGQGGTITTTAPSTQLAGAMIANGGALSGKGGSVETNADTLVVAATATINTANQDGVSAKGTWTVNLPSITVESNMAKVISSTLNTGHVALNAIASFFNLGQSQVIKKVSGDTTNLAITAKTDITLAGEINSDETAPLNLSLLGGQSIVMELLSTAKAASIAANAPTISAAGNLLAYGNSGDGSSLLMALIGARLSISGRVRASQNQTNDARILLSGSDEVAISATATINASDENGGSIDVMSEDGQVTIAGSILTNGENGRGGSITVLANESIAISSTTLLANGTTDGGTVKIISSSDDVNAQNSIIQTNGGSGLGGTILISGLNNTLISSSTIQANGFTNGGTIKIGYDATNQTLPFSSFTNIDSASVINANQLDTSSSNVNGGYIETSGQTLSMLAAINAGRGGMWLLDPYDVTIAASGETGTTYSSSFTAGATTTILASAINTSLNAGTNVSISTGSSSANTIYVNSEILATTGSATLTLTGGTINIAANITTRGSQTYTGAVVVNNASGITLTSTNSNITFSSTVNSVAGNYYGLTISNGSGTTAFGGIVGGTNALGYLCINASGCNASTVGSYSGTGTGTTTLAGNVTTSGNQTYAGALTLGANTVLTSTANSGNGAVTIAGNVNSSASMTNAIFKFLGSGNYQLSYDGSTWASYTATSTTDVRGIQYLGYSVDTKRYQYNFIAPTGVSQASILVVGGGGSGGAGNGWAGQGAGGGAGGVAYVNNYAITAGTISIFVGNGGAALSSSSVGRGNNGGASSFSSIVAGGGGGGGYMTASGSRQFYNALSVDLASLGGSASNSNLASTSTTGSVAGVTYLLNAGGQGNNNEIVGGGGGAGGAGQGGTNYQTSPGDGGLGIAIAVTTTTITANSGSTYYAAGGSGSFSTLQRNGIGGAGGNAGGSNMSGAANTGSGGGGANYFYSTGSGAGGSGIVMVAGGLQASQGSYTLTINAGTGKASIGGTVSNISTLAINSKSALSAVSGAIGGATLVSYNTATGYTGSSGAAGVLSLAGTNTYTGGTTVTGGTLQAGSTTAFGASASAITVNADAALDLNGKTLANTNALTLNGSGVSSGGALTNSSATAATYAGLITLGSAATINASSGNIVISNAGTITGATYGLTLTGTNTASSIASIIGTTSGTLTKSGTGTWTVSGANTYTGGTTISAGTLKAGSAAALGTGAVSIGASGTLDLTYSGTVALSSTLSMSTGAAITNSANTSNLSVAGASTLNGNINTAGNQTYTGAVTLGANTTLTTLNTSSVNTNGTITFSSTLDSTAGSYYGLSITNGTGTAAFGGIVGASSGTSALGYLCINASACNASTVGTYSGTGSGTTTLAGNVTTSGNQTYAGALTIGANTVLSSTANSGNGAVTIAGNVSTASAGSGYLYLEGLGYTNGVLTATSSNGVYIYGGTAYSLASGSSVTLAIGTLTYSGYSSTNYQSSYSFTPASSNISSLLIVGGGGGGGGNIGGGGGAGSVVLGSATLSGNISIVIGNGGISDSVGYSSSVIIGSTTFSALGGGRGNNPFNASYSATGGSGGGFRASTSNTGIYRSYQPAVTGMTSLANDGGMGTGGHLGGTGGGGAGSAGGLTSSGGNGGNGGAAYQWLDGNYYAGGGGGASGGSASGYVGIAGTGGGGGAGNGSNGNNSGIANPNSGATSNAQGYAATHGTGSGGGGGSFNNNGVASGGAGGSGVVAFTYDVQGTYTLTINAGTGKAAIGGTVSNISTLAINSKSALSAVSGAIGGATLVSYNTATGYTGSSGAAGVLSLAGTNTYTGGTTVTGGTLQAGSTTAFGASASAITVNADAALDLNGKTLANTNALTLNGSGVSSGGALTNSSATGGTYVGAVTLGSDATIGSTAGAITVSGTIASSGSAYKLALVGNQAITLSSATNTLSTIASGSSLGALSITNNQALTIGSMTIGATTYSGLSSTGTILVKTITGNLTVNNSVVTTSTSSDTTTPAIKLSAGFSDATTSTTNNIILDSSFVGSSPTNAITAGTGAIIAMYSGSAASSTNLSVFTSGQSTYFTTYGVTTTTGSLATGAGYYALYRGTQPTLYVIFGSSDTPTYGTAPTITYTFNTLANGTGTSYLSSDTSIVNATGTALFKGTNTSTSTSNVSLDSSANAGSYGSVFYLSGLSSPVYTLSAGTTAGTLTINKANAYVMITSAQSSIYGATPTINYTYYNNAAGTGGSAITSPTGLTGTASITNAPTASSDAGTYNLTYASGLSSTNYAFNGATSSVAYSVSPKPITISNSVSSTTYNGVRTYATLVSNAGFSTDVSLVGSDAIGSVTQATTISGNAVSGIAQAGSFVSTPSAAVLSTGSLSNYDFTYVAATNTVAKANLALTGTASTSGNIYNGNVQTSSYTTTFLGSDAASATIAGTVAQTNAGTYSSSLSVTGAILDNYNTPVITNASFVISPKPISYTTAAATGTYGTLSTLSTATFAGLVGSDDPGATVTAYSGATPVTLSATTNAGTYTQEVSALSNTNYAIASTGNTVGNLVISPLAITYTTTAATGTYGTLSTLSTATFAGLVGSDDPGATVTAYSGATPVTLATTTNAGTYTQEVSALSNGNYQLASTGHTIANLVISPLAITITGANNQVTYNHNAQTNSGGTFTIGSGSASAITSTNIPTGVGSQGFTLSGYGSGTNASVTPYADSLVMTANTGTQVSNYSVTLTNNGSGLTINKANLSATGTQAYNGTATIAGASLTVSGVGGETFSATGLADLTTKNVQTNQALANTNGLTITTALNGPSLDNYFPLSVSNTSVSITPLAVTLTAPSITKTYDGGYTYNMTAANLATMSGQLVGGDSVSAAEVLFTGNDANVGTNKSVRLNSATISDGNGGSNYTVTLADSSSSEVTAAVLTVSANNAAKFVTESDTSGFNGVVYTGFVNGETASSALSGTLTVTRTNASTNAAGNYTGVLIPGGLTANHGNYTITPLAGNLTITAADQLLVEITPVTTSYGTAASYTATAKYLSCSVAGCPSSGSSNVIHTLSPVITGNAFSVSDGAGGSAAFTIIPVSATSSGAGYTNVGGYQLAAGTVTGSSSNFSNTIALTGALTVEPLTLTASQLGVSGVSKVYNGSNAISGLSLTTAGSSTILSGDAVTVIGTGTYANANVGTSKSVTVAVGLTGADAGNYVLQTNQITDNIGTITQLASVTYTPTSGSNWSNASNWAGGAIPTLGNVATVIIPTDTTVVYDTANLTGLIPTSAITDNGTISFTSVSPTTFANDVSGTGSIALSGLGAVTLTGTNTQSGGTSIASGASLIAGSATALSNNTLTSAGGSFAVANGVTLPSLTVNGAVTLGSDITTSGAQTYNGAVSLGDSISLLAPTSSITFNANVGNTAMTEQHYDEYVASHLDNSIRIYNLAVVASRININADVTTYGTQTYGSTTSPTSVFIGDNGSNGVTRSLISEDPAVTFYGTIDDTTVNTHNLIVKAIRYAGAADVPTIAFNGDVGSTVALLSLAATTGQQSSTPVFTDTSINANDYVGTVSVAGDVTTLGDQTYTANSIALGGGTGTQTFTTTGGDVTFNVGTTNGASNITASNPLEMQLDGGSHNLSGTGLSYTNIIAPVPDTSTPTATASLEGLAGLIQGNFGQTAKQVTELSASGRATVEVSVISDQCAAKATQNNNECR